MRTGIIILTILTLIGCNNSEQKSTKENERFELVPEPDKDLREEYENQKTDSTSDEKSHIDLNDTIVLTESINIKDEIVNEYLTEDLEPIRKNFKRINSIQKWTSNEKFDLWESTEGGQAVFYYAENLEKVIVRYFGETGQRLIEYYLMEGKLSFVFDKSFNYNRPIYWDSTAMKENHDNQVFDFEQSEIIEERSYFLNDKLVHQLNNQDCGSPFADDYLFEEQARIQTEFKKIMKLTDKK
jgi:hypothetical protein